MQFIQGKNRTQSILFPESPDQIAEQNNEVRIIDLFVESINLSDFKFIIKPTKEGRPAYHPCWFYVHCLQSAKDDEHH